MSKFTEEKILLKEIEKLTGRPCFKCSICGEIFYGYGNNPYPVTKGENDRCCDACDQTKVIPARIHALMHKEDN